MIARAGATVERGGRVVGLHGQPPLSLRQVRSAGSARSADGERADLCLVGAAAGPLAGDDLRLDLTVRAGSTAWLDSTGASLAQGRHSQLTHECGVLETVIDVESGATLRATPPPFVACAGSSTEVRLAIELADLATLDWRELVVLGRTDEEAGSVVIDWDVQRGGRPLLRQTLDLRDSAAARWRGLIAGSRVIATRLIVDPVGLPGRRGAVVRGLTSVAQPLDEASVLLTVLGDDAASADVELDRLTAEAMG